MVSVCLPFDALSHENYAVLTHITVMGHIWGAQRKFTTRLRKTVSENVNMLWS